MSATTNGHATPGAFLDQIAGGAQVVVRDEEWLVRAVQHTCGCASTQPATNTTCSVPVSNSVPCSRSPHRNAPTSAPLCLMSVGLRGVGKTVLINRFCEIAADEDCRSASSKHPRPATSGRGGRARLGRHSTPRSRGQNRHVLSISTPRLGCCGRCGR